MAVLKEERKYTSDEFLDFDDLEGRYELIRGRIYDMSPAPSLEHQRISRRLLGKIDAYIMENGGKCEVFDAPADVKLSDDTTVQPDIFVVCDPEKLDGKKCVGAPDWVIEILSPSSIKHDMMEKVSLYSENGVREYWIVDPECKKTIVYDFETQKPIVLYPFAAEIPAGIYRDMEEPLTICIEKLLG